MFGGIGSGASSMKRTGFGRASSEDNPEKLMKALAKAAEATESSGITRRGANRPTSPDMTNPFYNLRKRLSKTWSGASRSTLRTGAGDGAEEDGAAGGGAADADKVHEKVTLNVGGTVFLTFRDTLTKVPCTRLYYLMKTPVENLHPDEFDAATGSYFFDRHPGLFEHILNYYRTGQLHVPRDICWPLFDNELAYWGLDHTHLESCCWMVYRHHTDNENTLKALDEEDSKDKIDPRIDDVNPSAWTKAMVKLWELFDDPMSSSLAKGTALLSLALILISVAIFCLETHELFREKVVVIKGEHWDNETQTTVQETHVTTKPKKYLFYIETVCIVWFCIEIFLRLLSCPSKKTFLKSPLNIVDFLAILPYFFDMVESTGGSTGLLRVVRVCRVFRVFKLTRHSTGLKILWHTLHASMKELFILSIFMALGVVIFASLIFYAERLFEESNVKTDFVDIPHGFWWALVTMTTLGYGDMVPETFAGQIVGSLCALCGLLTIALPVPVIVSNFSLYYSHYQAKVKLPKNISNKHRNSQSGASPDDPDPGSEHESPHDRCSKPRSRTNSDDNLESPYHTKSFLFVDQDQEDVPAHLLPKSSDWRKLKMHNNHSGGGGGEGFSPNQSTDEHSASLNSPDKSFPYSNNIHPIKELTETQLSSSHV